MRRTLLSLPAALLTATLGLFLPGVVRADDKVNFGTDWVAEAEYGGYYQALAKGIYKAHGLDVTIRPGGPSVNQTQLLLAGRLDFNIASNSFVALNFVKENIPFKVVASMYQKDPSVLIAHPGQGNDNLAALKGKPIMIGGDTRVGWWNFLRAKYGYSDSQIRPYNFSLAPFLADKTAIQQGFLGSEPFSIQQEAKIDPVVMLVADGGFTGYAQLFAASDKLIREKPELVQRFVDASIEGWYSYLFSDPTPGNTLIKKDNPEMTDALIAYGRTALIQHGILDSGDATATGIGAMTDKRWGEFHTQMAAEGVYPKDLDYKRAYTLDFVNKKVGLGPRK
jgi:NitT/TauT family transport system substrate-binding protein